MSKNEQDTWVPIWRDATGAPLACKDKLLVLNETFAELKDVAQDAFEDAILVGCDEQQVRETMVNLLSNIDNPYKKGS